MFGLIRVGAAAPKLAVADCEYNKNEIIKVINEAYEKKVQVLTFPELCITGFSCGDLFWQKTLLEGAEKALMEIAAATKGKEMFVALGMPLAIGNNVYDVAAAVFDGEILGFVPKQNIAGQRQFSAGKTTPEIYAKTEGDEDYPLVLADGLFTALNPDFKIGLVVGDDLYAEKETGFYEDAVLILNLTAKEATVVSEQKQRSRLSVESGIKKCAFVQAGAGFYESTQDMVFGAQTTVCENGDVLAEGKMFASDSILTVADVDIEFLQDERRKANLGANKKLKKESVVIAGFSFEEREDEEILRNICKNPFAPEEGVAMDKRCEDIFQIQCYSLVRRAMHIHSQKAVVGISGGLDSTLALLVTVKAFDILGIDRKNVIGITMPGFGTTDRTYNNALDLMKALGITVREISVVPSMKQHFIDINHDINNHNVAYENAQARERTQILMDIANDENGIVVGTGDLSELALGWATYNGDHMSMYAVNAGVPKTLVRLVVDWVSKNDLVDSVAADILQDVLATPISPELLPPTKEGTIKQKTEDIVGPYELHDFFLYYVVRYGFAPAKIYAYAKKAWGDVYDNETLLKWLRNFYRRFFTQQFKRSCMPDGPMVGSVTLSPRGAWQMPTDAVANLWLTEVDSLK